MEVTKRSSIPVKIGTITIGGDNPIIIQSMTNTDTADIEGTTQQILRLHQAGSEIVRITVDRPQSAKVVAKIKERLNHLGCDVPLVGDFHYNGHRLLKDFPDCAQSLDKYRINPGNVGFREKRDVQFCEMIEIALKYNKPVRIGVNGGSLDQELLTNMMEQNSKRSKPKSANTITLEAIAESAIISAKRANELGMEDNKIILSTKVSSVTDSIIVHKMIANKTVNSLHLGLTEAGMGMPGIVSSTVAIAFALQQGIGDTIRISLTPAPNGDRTLEVQVAKQILQSLQIRSFTPRITACPGCGRTTSTTFQVMAEKIDQHISTQMPLWKQNYPGVEELKIAVMGCIVNGPGESKNADIGISLPGTGESPTAPVFIDGRKFTTLRGENITNKFIEIIEDYVKEKYNKNKT